MKKLVFDVIVAGAGAGGICAAVAAARTGARVALVEKNKEIGGTGVHSPVSLVCTFHGSDHRPVNIGLHQELFPEAYAVSTKDKRDSYRRPTYDEKVLKSRYKEMLSGEPGISVLTGRAVERLEMDGRRIRSLVLSDESVLSAPVYVDGTADGNLAAMAGCGFDKGRNGDGGMQSATLTFVVGNVDASKLRIPEFITRKGCDSMWEELTPLLKRAQEEGRTANPKGEVVAFAYPDGKRLLFNSNELVGIDPTVPGSVEEGMKKGRRMVDDLFAIIRQHPAFAGAALESVSPMLGVREGRRIHGDYTLTEQDCLGEARFDDMVAACAYCIDIHDPDGGPARMVWIPGSGYYHIPYRCLIAKDADNLLLGSRCISGTHEAHSSYRVISGVTAIGQAAGTAATLAARHAEGDVRKIPSSWIRYILRREVQFVEGDLEPPPNQKD
ncbi:MAG: FAD-dependent oxidoreductase [Oceanipulchritudo sp.]